MIGTKTELIKFLADAPNKTYEVKEYHPKRSLTANSYYHALKAKLAGAIGTSNQELHEELLRRYSEPWINPKTGKPKRELKEPDTDWVDEPGHWMPFRVRDDGWIWCYRLIGSSEMDSKQMSRLVDGLVSECKEVGIETMTAKELASLKGYISA